MRKKQKEIVDSACAVCGYLVCQCRREGGPPKKCPHDPRTMGPKATKEYACPLCGAAVTQGELHIVRENEAHG